MDVGKNKTMLSKLIRGQAVVTAYLIVASIIVAISCLAVLLSPVVPKGNTYRLINNYFKVLWYYWTDLDDLLSSNNMGDRAIKFLKDINR